MVFGKKKARPLFEIQLELWVEECNSGILPSNVPDDTEVRRSIPGSELIALYQGAKQRLSPQNEASQYARQLLDMRIRMVRGENPLG